MKKIDDLELLRNTAIERLMFDLLFDLSRNQEELCTMLQNLGQESRGLRVMTVKTYWFKDMHTSFTADDANVMTSLLAEQIRSLLENQQISGDVFKYDRSVYLLLYLPLSAIETVESLSQSIADLGRELYKTDVQIGLSGYYTGIDAMRAARIEADRNWHTRQQNDTSYREEVSREEWNAEILEKQFALLRQAILSNHSLVSVAEEIGNTVLRGFSTKEAGLQILGETLKLAIFCEQTFHSDRLNEQLQHHLQSIYLVRTQQEIRSLILDICRAIQNHIILTDAQKSEALINQSKEFVCKNLGRRLTLDEVAGQVFLSRYYFCKLFKEVTGENFKDYLARQRMNYAKELIRVRPELKIYEVAELAGYKSERYFSQLFKKIFGTTPYAYKRIGNAADH